MKTVPSESPRFLSQSGSQATAETSVNARVGMCFVTSANYDSSALVQFLSMPFVRLRVKLQGITRQCANTMLPREVCVRERKALDCKGKMKSETARRRE